MNQVNFEDELLDAIRVSIEGTGIRPEWVFKHIIPIVNKYLDTQSSLATDEIRDCVPDEDVDPEYDVHELDSYEEDWGF